MSCLFLQLLPFSLNLSYTSKTLALRRGVVYNTCVRSAMLYGSDTWAPRIADLDRLKRNERGILRWMCGVRPGVRIGYSELCRRLDIPELDAAICQKRLRWFGHASRSQDWINQCMQFEVEGTSRRGYFKTWSGTVKDDLRRRGIRESDVSDRDVWRKHVSSITIRTPN